MRRLPQVESNWNALLQTLEGHSGSVITTGRQAADIGIDRTVKLWDAGSGAVLQTLEGDSSGIRAVTFSPDGKQLASASGDTVKLWDAGSGAVLQMLKGHSGYVEAVAFSPDGKQLASVSLMDKIANLWDAGSPLAVTFPPDGRRQAAGVSIFRSDTDIYAGRLTAAPGTSIHCPL
jgi:WD40 repeat protein